MTGAKKPSAPRRAVQSGVVSPPASPAAEVREMADVLAAVMRIQTRALVFSHLAEQVMVQFGVGDSGPPRLLLRLPGGGPFPADTKHVVDIAADLGDLASVERGKLARLLAANVSAAPADIDAALGPRGPVAPARPGEGVVDAGMMKPSAPRPSDSAAAVKR